MNRAGLLVVIVALVLAVLPSWTPTAAASTSNSQEANIAVANVIDASVKSAPTLSTAARDQSQLATLLANRDIHVVNLDQLVSGDQADMVSDVLHGSDVLSNDRLLLQTVARNGGPLSDMLAAHDIPVDNVVAVDLTDDTAAPLTVYLFSHQ